MMLLDGGACPRGQEFVDRCVVGSARRKTIYCATDDTERSAIVASAGSIRGGWQRGVYSAPGSVAVDSTSDAD
jgi:hypothetical protein